MNIFIIISTILILSCLEFIRKYLGKIIELLEKLEKNTHNIDSVNNEFSYFDYKIDIILKKLGIEENLRDEWQYAIDKLEKFKK